jgi:probable phosphoglycerate mutase
MTVTLHFVRHGQEVEGFRGGWSRYGLSEFGQRQVHALVARCRRERLQVDTVISSDLPRAWETGEPLAEALGVPLIPCEQWREANNGVLAGMPNGEAERLYPGLYWHKLEMQQTYPGGESPIHFRDRVMAALEGLCRAAETGQVGPRVLAVTHGGPIRVVASAVLGLEWTNAKSIIAVGETSLHTIQRRGAEWSLLRLNDTAHLADLSAS